MSVPAFEKPAHATPCGTMPEGVYGPPVPCENAGGDDLFGAVNSDPDAVSGGEIVVTGIRPAKDEGTHRIPEEFLPPVVTPQERTQMDAQAFEGFAAAYDPLTQKILQDGAREESPARVTGTSEDSPFSEAELLSRVQDAPFSPLARDDSDKIGTTSILPDVSLGRRPQQPMDDDEFGQFVDASFAIDDEIQGVALRPAADMLVTKVRTMGRGATDALVAAGVSGLERSRAALDALWGEDANDRVLNPEALVLGRYGWTQASMELAANDVDRGTRFFNK